MSTPVTAAEFLSADGVEDWQVLPSGEVAAHFVTRSFAAGVALVDEIGRLAEAANHHPDVDLRYKSVTVRVISHDIGALSQRDVKLARAVSAAARELGAQADPGAL